MDFLRQLHPSRGLRSDAAAPDIGAWRVVTLPVAEAAPSASGPKAAPWDGDAGLAGERPGLGAAVAAGAGRRGAGMSAPAPAVDSGRDRATLPATPPMAAAPGEPGPASGRPEGRSPGPSPEALDSLARQGVGPRASAPTGPPRASTLVGAPRATPDDGRAGAPIAPDARAASRASRGEPGAVPPGSPGRSLRATVQPLRSNHDDAQPAAAPPVVHVTIDRIDVRVPAAAPAVGVPRKPRAAAASSTLADYLRGRPGGPS